MDCDDAFSAAPDNVMDNAMDGDMMIIDHNEEVLERLGDESIPNEPTGSIRINAITKGLDQSYPPIDNVEDMFLDAVTTACERFGLDKIVDHFNRRPLKVATMCSGTDSPILAFRLIKEVLHKHFSKTFEFQHLFSAEIEPFKQGFLERNFCPDLIFRDVRELHQGDEATTAYGQSCAIPKDIDMLIAGFSCVDFSNLNHSKKTLADCGESGDTFWSILQYIIKYRPPMVILENVKSAPWETIQRIFQNDIEWLLEFNGDSKFLEHAWPKNDPGYAAEYSYVDSKEYYIPQTRQRGYIILIDRKFRFADSQAKAWKDVMDVFKRPASSGFEAFLLTPEDPELRRAMNEVITAEAKSASNWDLCRIRNRGYRQQNGLGFGQPLTRSGRGQDHWQVGLVPQLGARIGDVLDIAHLRSAVRGFDNTHKARLLELSQNVDRATDSMPWGVCGCITPNGEQLISNHGRLLTGREALALQALPLQDLILTRETQAELLDLAGNAMTTTVIGAAILSALLVGHETVGVEGRLAVPSTTTPVVVPMHLGGLIPGLQLQLSEQSNHTAETLVSLAGQSRSMCGCEGQTSQSEAAVLQCRACSHTVCERCAGLPVHEYRLSTSPRRQPEDFTSQVIKVLPMRLELHIGQETLNDAYQQHRSHMAEEDWRIYRAAVDRMGEGEFRYAGIRRSQQWVVHYDGPHASLDLTIARGQMCWQVFARPDPAEPNSSRSRILARYPLARMIPSSGITTGTNLLTGEWRLNLPAFTSFQLSISGGQELIPSWEADMGIQDSLLVGKLAHTKLSITLCGGEAPWGIRERVASIVGQYELLRNCGTAGRSLHKRVTPDPTYPDPKWQQEPTYFFLDPERIGDPRLDKFVFAKDIHRLRYQQDRESIAWIGASWRPSQTQPRSIGGECYGLWVSCEAIFQDVRMRTPSNYHILRDETSLADMMKCREIYEMDLDLSCSSTVLALASFTLPLKNPLSERGGWEKGPWLKVDQIKERSTLSLFSWLLEPARSLNGFSNDWRPLNLPGVNQLCTSCGPTPPAIKWIPSSKNQTVLVPVEDRLQAGVFERAIKARVAPFAIHTRIDDDNNGQLMIGLNIITLAHRAISKFSNTEMSNSEQLWWRLTTNYTWPSELSLSKFTYRSNEDDEPSDYNFTVNAAVLGEAPVRLRVEQQRSLGWMLARESENASFLEQETEEAFLPTLNWLAQVAVQKSRHVRGGVLADEVGYGKTAMILALIDHNRSQSLRSAEIHREGSISLKATLVIVPGTLIEQWKGQITKFLGDKKYKVMAISRTPEFTKKTIADYQKADIILLSYAILKSQTYVDRLGSFAALPACPSKPREFEIWLDHAAKRISQNTEELKSTDETTTFGDTLKRKRKEADLDYELLESVPTKRLKGAAYTAQASKRGQPTMKPTLMSNTAPEEKDSYKTFKFENMSSWNQMKNPLLHMFHFDRVVLDEYTYLEDAELRLVSCIPATNRWLLSGTPRTSDFSEVKTIASFLGVHLGIDDDSSMALRPANARKIRKNMTPSEQFRAFSQEPSPAWHMNRHRQAQYFLDSFLRQNKTDLTDLPCIEYLRPITLPAVERAVNVELQMQIDAQDLTMSRGTANRNDLDRSRRVLDLLDESRSPEEALLKCCSYLNYEGLVSTASNTSMQPYYALIDQREAQYQTLHQTMAKDFRQAEWLRRKMGDESTALDRWKLNMEQNFEDPDATQKLLDLVNQARREYHESHQLEFYFNPPTQHDGNALGTVVQATNNANQATSKANKAAIKEAARAAKTAAKEMEKAHRAAAKEAERAAIQAAKAAAKARKEGPSSPTVRMAPVKKMAPTHKSTIETELRSLIGHLHGLARELTTRERALRFLKAANRISTYEPDSGEMLRCDCCNHLVSLALDVSVLVQCGHTLCSQCIRGLTHGECCIVDKCSAVINMHDVHLGTGFEEKPVEGAKFSAKFHAIIQLILAIPDDEQVLLFIQFDSLMIEMIKALDESRISNQAIISSDGRIKTKVMHNFQIGHTALQKKGLPLNPLNRPCAGANLVNANHIIFLSPLLAETDDEYRQSETQCIGRARRQGQRKTVYVYKFYALNTIDVDIVERHTRMRLVHDPEAEDDTQPWRLEKKDDRDRGKRWGTGHRIKDYLRDEEGS